MSTFSLFRLSRRLLAMRMERNLAEARTIHRLAKNVTYITEKR